MFPPVIYILLQFIYLATIFSLARQDLIQHNHWQSKVKIYTKYLYLMDIDIVIYESGQYSREICLTKKVKMYGGYLHIS